MFRMDNFKFRATEKFGAIQDAAKSAAGSGKTKVQDVYAQTLDAIRQLREAMREIWQHELVQESRTRIVAFTHDAAQRIRDGALPLSPMHLYEELKALLKDRVWRRSMLIFVVGFALGGAAGACVTLRVRRAPPAGPHARALHTQSDHSVILVEDSVTPSGARHDEVLVRVVACSLGTRDRAVLRQHAATLRGLLGRTGVTVAGGFAGVVLDAGRDVPHLELGDEVWGVLTPWSGGAASELLTIRHTRVSKRPTKVSTLDAAALPWAGCRVLSALAHVNISDDKPHLRVLICGAASDEGCLLIQLLSPKAHVTAIAPRHTLRALQDLGAQEALELDCANSPLQACSWTQVEALAARRGPWDLVCACAGAGCPSTTLTNTAALFKSTASKNAIIDLRPRALLTDRLPVPFSTLFGVFFYAYRALRWLGGQGSHTDWLEDRHFLTEGLQTLAQLVDEGKLAPVLDKVFLPQDFEAALAHACSDDSVGTTVIRFP